MPQYNNPFGNLTPVVKNLLIINFLMFFATWVLDTYVGKDLTTYLAAFYPASRNFMAWQIFTYMFMHGGLTHIFSNMLGLFFIGPILEYTFGPKRFLVYYFITGIGALLFQYAVQAYEIHMYTGSFLIKPEVIMMLPPGHQATVISILRDPILGASGAIFGLMMGIFLLYPDLKVYLYFLVPVKIKYLVPVYVIYELYSGLSPSVGDNVAHFAHVGGALVGFILIKAWGYQKRDNFF